MYTGLLSDKFVLTNSLLYQGDVWSLGVSMVHLLRGAHPFAALRSYWELRTSISSVTTEAILPKGDA
jgi:serine/threonine protein kinase